MGQSIRTGPIHRASEEETNVIPWNTREVGPGPKHFRSVRMRPPSPPFLIRPRHCYHHHHHMHIQIQTQTQHESFKRLRVVSPSNPSGLLGPTKTLPLLLLLLLLLQTEQLLDCRSIEHRTSIPFSRPWTLRVIISSAESNPSSAR